jgi:hypothetical protein
VVSRSDGVLRDLVGSGPNGSFHLRLVSIAIDPPKALPPIDSPSGPFEGADVTANFRGLAELCVVLVIRGEAYETMTAALDDAPWDEETHARIARVLRPLADEAVRGLLAGSLDERRRSNDELAGELRQAERLGVDATLIDETRARAKRSFDDALDQMRKRCFAELAVPTTKTLPARATRILEIEQEVMAQEFDKLIRDPLLAEFAKATGAAGR